MSTLTTIDVATATDTALEATMERAERVMQHALSCEDRGTWLEMARVACRCSAELSCRMGIPADGELDLASLDESVWGEIIDPFDDTDLFEEFLPGANDPLQLIVGGRRLWA